MPCGGRFYTQNRLSDEAFSEFKTEEDIEFNQLGALKMILMEQLRSGRLGPDRLRLGLFPARAQCFAPSRRSSWRRSGLTRDGQI